MNNDLLEDIFNILKLSKEEKEKTSNNLNGLIKTKLVNNLIEKLPSDQVEKIKNLEDPENEENKKIISSIINENFTPKLIEEEQKRSVGEIVLVYINYIYKNMGSIEKEKIAKVFTKYGIPSS